ncbi:MAG TPA: hypothetical protein VI583_15380 [Cyclobacteriaceae bacterium]|nr:hypothetical protein [Cyclobacteriaceae bacterium]
MKKRIIHIILTLLVFLAFTGIFSCKSSKKMTEASKTGTKTETTAKETDVAAKEEPETKKTEATITANAKLENYFSAIASSSSTESANTRISEALAMFASPDVPVIIAFYKENGVKDYDEPTTISKYLNYIKDQKKSPNKVENIVFNPQGKIEELELIKR